MATDLDGLRERIVTAFPELAGSRFTLITAGWDSAAVDVDGRLIFKFPRDEAAERRLRLEASLLARVRSAVTLPVPELTLHGFPLFSMHEKLPGDHLEPARYQGLTDDVRAGIAADLARFYAELHALPASAMAEAGARPVMGWGEADQILRAARAVLDPAFFGFAERTLGAWTRLPPDPYGAVYGFFDGHGWNMAFDEAQGRLRGIYDFADSGFGDLHQDFIYSNMISPDLTERIVTRYETLTGKALDRKRIELLTGVHRLWELAEYAGHPDYQPGLLKAVADWAAWVGARHGA